MRIDDGTDKRIALAVMLSLLFAVWVLHTAAMISPGANVLLVSQLAASGDRQGAWYAALGIATGALFWVSSAVLGVHVVFALFPELRLGLQIAGGAYLLYVAQKIWRSASGTQRIPSQTISPLQAYRLGFLTNITNPKSALFFSSIFATVFPLQPSPALQASAVLLVVTNALCWHLFLARALSLPRVQNLYARSRNRFNRVSAFLMGGMGVALLWRSLREVQH